MKSSVYDKSRKIEIGGKWKQLLESLKNTFLIIMTLVQLDNFMNFMVGACLL